jgi:hypothetical protein
LDRRRRLQTVGIRRAAFALLLSVAAGACSSGSDDAGGTTAAPSPTTASVSSGSDAPPATAADGEEATTVPAAPDTTTLAGYYESLGVAPDVAECYARELAALGITEIGDLEADAEKSAAAAGRFDACIADPTTGASTSAP